MDPREHAYGGGAGDPLFGEFGHDGYDYEGMSRGEFRQRMRDYDPDEASALRREEIEDEDDESGYNWGPVPPEHYGAVAEDHSGGDEDDPDWIREHSPRQQETNRKRGEEISRSKEMFARRATGRLPFDRTASGVDSSSVRPGPLVDAPLYEQDPDDYFGHKPYSGPYCEDCGRPTRYVSGPDCRHARRHAAVAPAPVVPGAHSYLPGHLVQSVWRDNPIRGIVTGLDGTRVWVRYEDGQTLPEEPQDIQPR
jgi:hypothetical protein